MYSSVDDDRPIPDNEAFTGVLGEIVKRLDPWSEADPIAVLSSLLSACSVLTQGGVRVYTGGKWQSPLLNVLLFGESAIGRKGTSGTVMFKVVTHRNAYPQWRTQHVSSGAPSSGAGLVKRLATMAIDAEWLIPLRQIPQERRVQAVEQPVTRLKRSFPALLYVQEIAKVLHRARMDDAYDDNIRCMWQGDDLKAKISKNAEVTLVDPVAAWLCHVTPAEFLAKLGRTSLAGGTFNRFLLFWVRRTKVIPREKPIPDTVLAPLAKTFKDRIEFGRTAGNIDLNTAAEKFWITELHPEVDRALTASPMWQEFTGRALDNILRMAAIYAAMDQRKEINATDLKAARAVQRYVFDSLPMVMRELGNNTPMGGRLPLDGDPKKANPALCKDIREYLITNGKTLRSKVTKAFANRVNPATGDRWTSSDIDNAIAWHNGDIAYTSGTGPVKNRPGRYLEWLGPAGADVPDERVHAAQPQRAGSMKERGGLEQSALPRPTVVPRAPAPRSGKAAQGTPGDRPEDLLADLL